MENEMIVLPNADPMMKFWCPSPDPAMLQCCYDVLFESVNHEITSPPPQKPLDMGMF